MIMRFAIPGAVIDVTQNAETKFRILVEDLAFGYIVTKVSGDESIVFDDILDQRADLLSALSTRIAGQYAVTFSGKLLECIGHPATSLIPMPVAPLFRDLSAYPVENLSARLRKSRLRGNVRGLVGDGGTLVYRRKVDHRF